MRKNIISIEYLLNIYKINLSYVSLFEQYAFYHMFVLISTTYFLDYNMIIKKSNIL